MSLRDDFTASLKEAMKAGDKLKISTLRLMTSALKDREIEARGAGKTISEDDILALLQKMVKQRQESLKIYTEAGRTDLAEQEQGEIAVIQSFLPQQMDADAVSAAIDSVIAETGAATIKDMGKVMAVLKERFAGRMDFGAASGAIKSKLG
jgi:uncharacterized protein YqeY